MLLSLVDNEKPTSIPVKTSVTALCKSQGVENLWEEPEENRWIKSREETDRLPGKRRAMKEKPDFLGAPEKTAADMGTAVHQGLAMADYAGLKGLTNPQEVLKETSRQLDQLTSAGRMTADQRKIIPDQWLAGFFKSDLGQRAMQSERCKREYSFNLRLHGGREELLQGVIDLCFVENGQWVLADYKTDRAQDEETLTRRYAAQLQYYAAALEKITGVEVRQIYLFALRAERAYEIEKRLPNEI
ncbi:MAG: PD-(D/E)XK nuclease family protein [Oscillospiraceae bacterium]|nr:PD-(D/E)XK nuclease family protein [Oscillospiraceae bacterium]